MPRRRRRNRRARLVAVLVALLAAGVTAWQAAGPAGGGAPAGGEPYAATVDHVVDGDTLVVRRDGRRVTVRLVQIDAPESSSSRYGAPDACGAAATRFAEGLTRPGATVTIEPAGRDAVDRYGRTLAIVRLGGPRAPTWQRRIVAAGWAEPYVVGGNRTPILGELRAVARRAERDGAGVWSRCDGRFHTAS